MLEIFVLHAKPDLFRTQRMVELAVTTSLQPKLMLLEEPTAGMSPAETERLIDLINTRLRSNCAFMLVEHDMKVVMGTADTITVLTRWCGAGGRRP